MHFVKDKIKMDNSHTKKCLSFLDMREIQIKTLKRFHLTPLCMAIIQKLENKKGWQGYGDKIVKPV